jgi:Icc-related predicted phosphoesterase
LASEAVVKATGDIEMCAAGSTAVRRFIEKYQPLLGLHGHIHEGIGANYIGRTLCINPGSEYAQGILRGVIIVIDNEKIKNYQFVSG